MRRHLALLSAVLVTATASLGLYAGPAFADGSTPAAGPAVNPLSTAAAPAAKPKPAKPAKPKPAKPAPSAVKGSVRIYLFDAFYAQHKTLIVPERGLHITGIVRPYVAGQQVTVRAYLGKRSISQQTLAVTPMRGGRSGRVVDTVKAPAPGTLHLEITHRRTAQMLGFVARRGVASLDPHAGFGSSGSFVALIQSRLAALHVYIPQTGVYDQETGLALDAYHRLLGHGTSQDLDGLTVSDLLDGRGAFTVRYPHDGKHVEGDLGNQLLAEINGGKVYAIYPISSGKPSTPTILGRFRVYQRTPGYLPDGMYYSDFFYGGYAIHGYDPAPDYAASHGCMRLPITDAISVWNWLTIGVAVDVYQ
ncbi:MAG: L,D-transpeptidase [Solirubrobacteraceae bacterium]